MNRNPIILALWTLMLGIFLLIAQFDFAEGYEDVLTRASYPGLLIPDGIGDEQCGDWATDSILVTELPPEAIVLSVDVFFTITHSWEPDLVVDLCYSDCFLPGLRENLWNRDGWGSYFYRENILRWWGLPANEWWKLRVKDCDIYNEGVLENWVLVIHYHVPPDPPPWVSVNTFLEPRHADVSWTFPSDPQYGGFIIRWDRSDSLLSQADYPEIQGIQYVTDPFASEAGVDPLYCGDTTHFMVNCYSIYGAMYEGPLPPPPRPGDAAYCTNVTILGKLQFVNWDYEPYVYPYSADTVPLANVRVSFRDAVTGDSLPILDHTDADGNFMLFADRVDHVLCAKFAMTNEDYSFYVADADNPTQAISVYSDTMGPDNLFNLIVDETAFLPSDTISRRFGEAAYGYYDIFWTKWRFQSWCSWTTPPVGVLYDWNNYDNGAYSFEWEGMYYIVLTRKDSDPPIPQYRTRVPYHEYAHTIHRAAWDTTVGGCPLSHRPDTTTNAYCALVEGWAGFVSCVVPDDQPFFLQHLGQDIEWNEWWRGTDGQNLDGAIVEGAVASGWYDLQDESIDSPDEYDGVTFYNLDDQMDNIFRVFKDQKPQGIHEFVDYWRDDGQITTEEKSRLGRIFEKHRLLIPGDCNEDGTVNVGDVVYLNTYLYKGGPQPNPLCVGNVNGDATVNVGDVVYLVSYLYKGGPAPQNGCD